MQTVLSHPAIDTWQWYQHQFRAMNTGVYIKLYSHRPSQAILDDVERLFVSFERRLSRFLPDSELSQLNACSGESCKVSPTMLGAVEVALWLAELTGGLYDPTILTCLEQAGYDRSFEQVTAPTPLTLTDDVPVAEPASPGARLSFSYRSVRIDYARHQLERPPGVKLDLGGMGKGWTVDRAADRLQGLGPFLVNAGGDIFAYHAPPGQRGWQINLTHPLLPELSMAQLYLHHHALATSTIARRRWRQNGRLNHHLINPRTGQPAITDALSVTVLAPRTVVAEVYAKTALIMGVEQGLAYLEQLPGFEGLIFTADRQIRFTSGLSALLEWVEPDGVALQA